MARICRKLLIAICIYAMIGHVTVPAVRAVGWFQHRYPAGSDQTVDRQAMGIHGLGKAEYAYC